MCSEYKGYSSKTNKINTGRLSRSISSNTQSRFPSNFLVSSTKQNYKQWPVKRGHRWHIDLNGHGNLTLPVTPHFSFATTLSWTIFEYVFQVSELGQTPGTSKKERRNIVPQSPWWRVLFGHTSRGQAMSNGSWNLAGGFMCLSGVNERKYENNTWLRSCIHRKLFSLWPKGNVVKGTGVENKIYSQEGRFRKPISFQGDTQCTWRL